MTPFLSIPKTASTYCIQNVTLASDLMDNPPISGKSCIYVKDGYISNQHNDGPIIDAKGAMLLPTFVDMHTHLDKGHIWPRAANPDGTFMGALNTVHKDREANWNHEDVRQRMDFALRCAYCHGTHAIRTHLDSLPPQHQITWSIFDEVREEWQGKIDLQAVSIFAIDLIKDNPSGFLEVADTAERCSGGVLGCVTYPIDGLDALLDRFFHAAEERLLNVDFHVDETQDPNSNTLRSIAQSARRTKYGGHIVVGHCCSLARQSVEEANETLDMVAAEGIAVVSLPMCNLYLQDRKAFETPSWRGVTLVHEMRQREIPVAFASDNTRDPFYAYGDLDMIEVMREATRICHLDHSEPAWFDSFTSIPAQICEFPRSTLGLNEPADFVICSSRNWSELYSRPQSDRIVVRNGQAIDRQLPDYRELDNLFMVE